VTLSEAEGEWARGYLRFIGNGSWYEAVALKKQGFEGIIIPSKRFQERGRWRKTIRRDTKNPN
jgi:hypothetical protein